MALNIFSGTESDSTNKSTDALVEFKAGRMFIDDNTNVVTAEKRRGLVQLKQSPDGLVHFMWKDRVSGAVEHDLYLFPGDAVFRKVVEANARVYLLDLQSGRKLFFWMQEASDENDKENCDKINQYINNPPQPGSTGATGGEGTSGSDDPLRAILQNASRRRSGESTQDRQPNRPAPQQGTSTQESTGSSGIQRSRLQNIISSFQQRPTESNEPRLMDVLNADAMAEEGVFQDQEIADALAEYLPEGDDTTLFSLQRNLRSPQFRQAVEMFTYGLRSGDLAGSLMSMGVDPSVVGPNSSIEEILLALQNAINPQDRMDTD
eukprot:TRINITY_DN7020_c0_g1_i1.p1 TRINITY_DN7020_c0_g1~~TRINITY_DN7020_c0_g1_i1.p1  ORF type:complete len:320 (+),score=78.90 TRINITY_DN7020_c0_g1_i1:36-995(+)